MRLLCITLVIIAGALLSCVGGLCQSISSSPSALSAGNSLNGSGCFLMVVGGILFIIEWWPVPASKSLPNPTPKARPSNA